MLSQERRVSSMPVNGRSLRVKLPDGIKSLLYLLDIFLLLSTSTELFTCTDHGMQHYTASWNDCWQYQQQKLLTTP